MLKNKVSKVIDEQGNLIPNIVVYSPLGSIEDYGLIRYDGVTITKNEHGQIMVTGEGISDKIIESVSKRIDDLIITSTFEKKINVIADIPYIIPKSEHKQTRPYSFFLDESGNQVFLSAKILNGDVIIVSPTSQNNITVYIGLGLTEYIIIPEPMLMGLPIRTPGLESQASVMSINGMTNEVILTPNELGLGKVNNTADEDKPISKAARNELNRKVNKEDIKDILDKITNILEEETKRATTAESNILKITQLLDNTIAEKSIKIYSTTYNSIPAFINNTTNEKELDILNSITNNDILITSDGVANIYSSKYGDKTDIMAWYPFSINLNLNNYVRDTYLESKLLEKADLTYTNNKLKDKLNSIDFDIYKHEQKGYTGIVNATQTMIFENGILKEIKDAGE